MMHWLNDAMWAFCRAVAWALQLAGFGGILAAALLGIRALAGRIEMM